MPIVLAIIYLLLAIVCVAFVRTYAYTAPRWVRIFLIGNLAFQVGNLIGQIIYAMTR